MNALAPWLFLPFLLQGAVMTVDEFVFHRSRGLPKWERIGHPIDTLSVLLCYAWALAHEPTHAGITVFLGLGLASALLVTKDEGVHHGRCGKTEHWLHAVLFITHPMLLAGIGGFWWLMHHGDRPLGFAGGVRPSMFLSAAAVLTAAFMAYQLIYWNFTRERSKSASARQSPRRQYHLRRAR